METCSVDNSTSARMNKWVEKFSVWIVGILVSIGGFLWTNMDTRINSLEDKVSFLYQDKVSRAELKEEMKLLRAQSEQNKNDILARLELIIKLHTQNALK